MSARNRFYREPDWTHVCDWTQEQFDAEETVARRQAERNERRELTSPDVAVVITVNLRGEEA